MKKSALKTAVLMPSNIMPLLFLKQFSYSFQNSLLKYSSSSNYNTDAGTIKNEDPGFQNYFTRKMNLRLKENSPAKGKADPSTAGTVPFDIVKVSRAVNPSIGAYQ